MVYNVIRAGEFGRDLGAAGLPAAIRADLDRDGYSILRGFDADMTGFSGLVGRLCRKITFDPARQHSTDKTQMVDAGLGPIGLHIENGNTPICPDLVAFYSRRAAFEGSQTTICDGVALWQAMDGDMRARWSQPMTVERILPEALWKRYLANEHPAISTPEEVTMEHVLQFQQAVPGQDFEMRDDGSITYRLTVTPARKSAFSGLTGFANAVLGPSHNYQPPRYRLADGSEVTAEEIELLRGLAEGFTTEINWQDGDVAVIDNTRVMHGRRAIADADRELFIGMGSL